jgi:signal transduction histidine kinase
VPITVHGSFAISTHEGKVATIGFLRDITERKKGEKALWRSQRLASIGRLAAEIAHEMNNPLTSVLTFCKLASNILQQEPFPTQRASELRDYISYLNSETERCANISRNLLDFSRQSEIEIRENDIHEILDKTLTILRHRAGLDAIEIQTDYAPELPFLSCDFKRLQQAFVNILWNAIEAMPEGGKLTVATNRGGHPRGGGGENFRAILYNQGRRQRRRPRTLCGLWHHPPAPRRDSLPK